jgi:hypothetical protein
MPRTSPPLPLAAERTEPGAARLEYLPMELLPERSAYRSRTNPTLSFSRLVIAEEASRTNARPRRSPTRPPGASAARALGVPEPNEPEAELRAAGYRGARVPDERQAAPEPDPTREGESCPSPWRTGAEQPEAELHATGYRGARVPERAPGRAGARPDPWGRALPEPIVAEPNEPEAQLNARSYRGARVRERAPGRAGARPDPWGKRCRARGVAEPNEPEAELHAAGYRGVRVPERAPGRTGARPDPWGERCPSPLRTGAERTRGSAQRPLLPRCPRRERSRGRSKLASGRTNAARTPHEAGRRPRFRPPLSPSSRPKARVEAQGFPGSHGPSKPLINENWLTPA